MRLFVLILTGLSLTACNSVYMKPHTLDKNSMIYAPRGGSGMARSIKETMEERGYKLNVGKLVRVSEVSGSEIYQIPKDSKYAVNVKESAETLRPIWCAFNGFWWWRFNVSIIERDTNTELLSWRGRGCADSSLRKLNKYLDELEMKQSEIEPKTNIPSDGITEADEEEIAIILQNTQDNEE